MLIITNVWGHLKNKARRQILVTGAQICGSAIKAQAADVPLDTMNPALLGGGGQKVH